VSTVFTGTFARPALLRYARADRDRTNVCRGRYLPKPIHKANQLKRTMLESRRVKEERRRKHTRAGENKPKAEKKTVVVREQT
jgi:WD repeat and SOF domain-containing protein 1